MEAFDEWFAVEYFRRLLLGQLKAFLLTSIVFRILVRFE